MNPKELQKKSKKLLDTLVQIPKADDSLLPDEDDVCDIEKCKDCLQAKLGTLKCFNCVNSLKGLKLR